MAKHKSMGVGKRLAEEAMKIIAESESGRVRLAELLVILQARLPDLCDDSEDKRGRLKWKMQFFAYSPPSLFEKGNGEWSLTEEGWEWSERLKSGREYVVPEPKKKDASAPSDSGLTAEVEVETFVLNRPTPKNERKGEWFENTVAALLRGMGYQYVHVTKQSWDGGVDVIAYEDDLGIVEPRIKVQVKHSQVKPPKKGKAPKIGKVGGGIISQLANVVREGEVGMCVTSSSFNRSAESFALTNDKHLLLVDGARFAQLWVKYRGKMEKKDRDRIPDFTKNKKPRRGKNAAD